MKLHAFSRGGAVPPGQPDPFIFFDRGVYYIYATHQDGVQLYRSHSITGEWEYLGFCFTVKGCKNYWAPAVIRADGKYYLYVSYTPENGDPPKTEALNVAVSDSPEGPFVFAANLLPPFSIDAHVVEYKGSLYLFYSLDDEKAARPGTYIALDRMTSPTQVEGHPVRCVVPTLDEEIFCRDRYRKGEHWHTIEGAFYSRIGGTHYLTYSGSAYGRPTYFVGCAVAHGDPEDLRELQWQKQPDDHTYAPLLCANSFVEGTGHNSVIEADGQWWIVYHGRDVGVERPQNMDCRVMRADKLNISGDRLSVTITV